MKKMRIIILDYCSWTGQMVNKQKSAIVCGKAVNRNKVKVISKIWAYKVSNELNYLGIKLVLRRLVASDFNSLFEKATNKLNIWGNQFISLPGRILLVKTILLALPIFFFQLTL
ncbi:hypothetical protein KFK09_022809 [Dendrobium nobile]|uniref:Reverse transcriptase n=1 Tax=Dendrobium nobile TaxID=94219 RepID=A0A8T3AKZ3_DENNO|nr:hypothetical protein KFK09_022809 [Dendrobium nobile]